MLRLNPIRSRGKWAAGAVGFAALVLACGTATLIAAGGPIGEATATARALPHLVRAHYLMGTVFTIETYHQNTPQAEAAIEEAFQLIRRADEMMSHYRDESALSLLNREAASRPVPVPAELYSLLRTAQHYNELTAGTFDITTSSLTAAWQQAEERGSPLSPAELATARSLMGSGRLLFDDEHRTVRFDRSGVRIDLGGIAKGWAVDRAAELLRARGIRSALISAGTSTLYAIGAPPGEHAWAIGIRTPEAAGEDLPDVSASAVLGTVELRDASLSTSSPSERYFSIQGKRYSHVLDPRTGSPAENLASATVVAPTATQSDALSTAAFVLGWEQSAALLRRQGAGGLLLPIRQGAAAAAAQLIPYPAPGARIAAVCTGRVS